MNSKTYKKFEKFILDFGIKIRKRQLLENYIKKLYDDFAVTPIIGVELEFYLSKDVAEEISNSTNIILKKEKGRLQYEIDIEPQDDITKLIKRFYMIKQQLKQNAEKIGAEIIFAAKPYPEDYGSSMHIHFNLLNSKNINLFDNNNYKDLIASGLCDSIKDDFLAFAPTHNCYLRYDKAFMAPTKISYGNNNRSVAIRTPDAKPKRLEHRVASSNADLYVVLFCILKSAYNTLSAKDYYVKHKKIYGNAFDEQYNLESLHLDMKSAYRNFARSYSL